jgi:predicted CopG family antitoxin
MAGKTKYKNTSNITVKGITNIDQKMKHGKESFSNSINNYNSIREQIDNEMSSRVKPKDANNKKSRFKID